MTAASWEQQAKSFFLVELAELIDTAEAAALALEQAPDPEQKIHVLFRAFHTIKGGAGMVGWPELARYTNQMETLLAKVRSGALTVSNGLISLLLESIDCLKGFYKTATHHTPLPKPLIDRSLAAMAHWGEDGQTGPSAPVAPEAPPTANEPAIHPPEQTIRVAIDKLNLLLNLTGEAVTNHARLVTALRQLENAHEALAEPFWPILDDQERISRALQEQVNTLRMVPIGATLHTYHRMVRDYALQSGKQIRLQVVGGETELDKEVIERLSAPLNHLMRNAMDHGIEAVAQRREAGKPPQGTITLRAEHHKGSVLIEVADDGCGLDEAKILAAAREKGLLRQDALPNPEEIRQLLFQPGFSTRQTVTDLSGRGVGLDVVKQEVAALRGTITIHNRPGAGCAFLIQLPLTLAIIEGMLVRVAEQIFTIPLVAVVETLQARPDALRTIHQRQEMVEVRGEYLPLIRLHHRFNLAAGHSERPVLVLVECGGRKSCLLVDELIDQQSVVIKNVEENFAAIPDITGATILGDGSLSLILDINGLTSS